VTRLLLVGSCLLLVGLLLLVALTGCDLTAPAAGAPPVATTYLMAPPRYALDKPLREWQQLGTFESVTACNVDRNQTLYEAQTELGRVESVTFTKDGVVNNRSWQAYLSWQVALFSLCVAPSDARLAR